MLEIKLRKLDAPFNCTATISFPASEPDLQEEMDRLGIGITTEKQCLVEAVRNEKGGLQALIGKLVNADEIQFLAKRMDSFDKNELTTFYAVAEHERLGEVKDLINLTFNLHCYSLINDFSDIAAIGKKYELDRRTEMAVEEIKNIDFTAIGRELFNRKRGVITPYGVLYSTDNIPELVYDGKNFPRYCWSGADVATVILEPGENPCSGNQEYLYLPCSEVEIEKAINRMGLKIPCYCTTQLEWDELNDQIYNLLTEKFLLFEHLYTVNKLAENYACFDEASQKAFQAIAEMACPETPEELVILADNFYEFDVIPGIKTSEEYGRYMITDSGKYEIDEDLTEYFDFKKYGEKRIQMENGVITDYGYIAYKGNTPEVEKILGQNDLQKMEIGGMHL